MNLFDKISSPEYQQEKSEKEIYSFVKNKIEDVRSSSSRSTHETIWMSNIAYVLGFSNVIFDANLRQFRTANRNIGPVYRSKISVNKILPTLQNRLARICKSQPKYDIRPNSNDQDDKDAAQLGLQIINMVWDSQKINEKRIPLMMWVQECGHAFVKVSWDDTLGKRIDVPDAIDPLTGQMIPSEPVYEGDVRVEIVSPFEVYCDPLAKTMDEVKWLVQAKVRKLSYFRDHYPNGDQVKEEGAWLLSTQYELRINSMNAAGPATSGTQLQMKDAAIELAYYEKPSKKYPNGRMIICANGIVLADKELPCGELPFVKFDDIVIGGKFYSEATVTHLRPIQDQYNRVISSRSEWTNKLLAGKYIAAKGHGLIAESLNDRSGEVVEYNSIPGAPPPMAMNIPVMPQYAYTEEDRLNAMMYEISGISEVSRGQLPSASIPAIGMQLLVEQDETRIGIMTESHDESWANVGKLILKYVEKYYITERVLKVSKNNSYAVKKFMGNDLKGNTDVIVIKGSTLPNSKVIKRQEITNLFQMGLLGDPNDPKVKEKVLNMMEYGDIASVWEDQSLDTNQIQKDLELIENEIAPEVNELDNHALHIYKKNQYRKSDKFQKLSLISQELLLANIEQHIQAGVALTNPEVAMQDELMANQKAAEGEADALEADKQEQINVEMGGL